MGEGVGKGEGEGVYLMLPTLRCPEEAKRFEEGLQEHKDFLYIQKKYVS